MYFIGYFSGSQYCGEYMGAVEYFAELPSPVRAFIFFRNLKTHGCFEFLVLHDLDRPSNLNKVVRRKFLIDADADIIRILKYVFTLSVISASLKNKRIILDPVPHWAHQKRRASRPVRNLCSLCATTQKLYVRKFFKRTHSL